MLSKSDELDSLRVDELMRELRENKDSDQEKAKLAYGEIYRKYCVPLWNLCLSVCGDTGEADMVYEITLQKIWKNPNYDYQKHRVLFLTWVSKIARNTWLDLAKTQVCTTEFEDCNKQSTDSVGYELEEDAVDVLPSFNMVLLEEALHELSEREYDILMRYIEYETGGNNHLPDNVIAELAKRYQTTPANLRQIKCRALKKVKDYLEQRK